MQRPGCGDCHFGFHGFGGFGGALQDDKRGDARDVSARAFGWIESQILPPLIGWVERVSALIGEKVSQVAHVNSVKKTRIIFSCVNLLRGKHISGAFFGGATHSYWHARACSARRTRGCTRGFWRAKRFTERDVQSADPRSKRVRVGTWVPCLHFPGTR